jgi:hypothetical protein
MTIRCPDKRKSMSENENMHKYTLTPNIFSLKFVFNLLVILVWYFSVDLINLLDIGN